MCSPLYIIAYPHLKPYLVTKTHVLWLIPLYISLKKKKCLKTRLKKPWETSLTDIPITPSPRRPEAEEAEARRTWGAQIWSQTSQTWLRQESLRWSHETLRKSWAHHEWRMGSYHDELYKYPIMMRIRFVKIHNWYNYLII